MDFFRRLLGTDKGSAPRPEPAGEKHPVQRAARAGVRRIVSVGAQLEGVIPKTEKLTRGTPRLPSVATDVDDVLVLTPSPAKSASIARPVVSVAPHHAPIPPMSVTPRAAVDGEVEQAVYRKTGDGRFVVSKAVCVFPGRSVTMGRLPTSGMSTQQMLDAAKPWAAPSAYLGDLGGKAFFILSEAPIGESDVLPEGAVRVPDNSLSLQEHTTRLHARLMAGQTPEATQKQHVAPSGGCLSHHNNFSTFAGYHGHILRAYFPAGYVGPGRPTYRVGLSAADYHAMPPSDRIELFHRMMDEIAALATGGQEALARLPPFPR